MYFSVRILVVINFVFSIGDDSDTEADPPSYHSFDYIGAPDAAAGGQSGDTRASKYTVP